MADMTVRFYSDCLKRNTTFKVYMPIDFRKDPWVPVSEYKDRPIKTLFLLHGYTGDADNWVPTHLSDKYNFAVIIPNGENGFWLDGQSTGHMYATFLGEELLTFVRKAFGLAMSPDDTYICGLSMGGFGALHTAFKYPDVFGKVIALSSALIVHEVAEMKEGEGNDVANYDYYRECFGDPKKLLESENNPETLIKKLKAEGKKIPEIFMSVGTEDFLLENNRRMHKFLEDENVPHVYEEDKGIHDMEFWTRYVEKFVPIVFA